MSKYLSWSVRVALVFVCSSFASVRAEDANDGKAKEAVRQFVKAVRAKDARALAAVVAVPWLEENDHIVQDAKQLDKLLRARLGKLTFPEKAEIAGAVPLSRVPKLLKGGTRRKRVDEILGKDGRLVVFAVKERLWSRVFFVRVRGGKAAVVGGPVRMSYLLDNKIPDDVRTILEKADQIELFSLDPDRQKKGKPSDGFHGWRVLGKTAVKAAPGRKELVAALKKAAADSDGAVAGCFNPRHGVRVTHGGQTADFVICFECLSAQAFVGEKKSRFLITSSAQPLFDKVLRAGKVPLAPKAAK